MGVSRLNFLLIALCFGFVLWLPSSVPQGVPGIAEAQAGSRNALYRKCGKAVFNKYSTWRIVNGMRMRTLPAKFSIPATDACVANGGRVV
jgi:hypothetical protein